MNEKYMKLAIEQAKEAKKSGEWPFGAVIVCNDKIVAQTQRMEGRTLNVLDHAESLAVSEACKSLGTNELRDCVIYCTNEPCLMCSAAIFQAKIPKVVIGASREDLPHLLRKRKLSIEDAASDSGFHIDIERGVLKDEVLDLFTDVKK